MYQLIDIKGTAMEEIQMTQMDQMEGQEATEDQEMTMIGQVISIDRIKEGQMILSSR